MANELKFYGDPFTQSGLIVAAEVFNSSGVQVNSSIACSEVNTAVYVGDMNTTVYGLYTIRFSTSSKLLGVKELHWGGISEVTRVTLSTDIAGVKSYLENSSVLYVSPSGDDSDNGFTRDTAFLTITAAQVAADTGTTINVMPGVYPDGNLGKTGVEYLFEHGAKIFYTGNTGSIFAGSTDIDYYKVSGYGCFEVSGIKSFVAKVEEKTRLDFICDRIISHTIGIVVVDYGFIRAKINYASTKGDAFSCQSDSASSFGMVIDCDYAISDYYVLIMGGGGNVFYKGKYIESTSRNPIENSSTGLAITEGAHIVAPSGSDISRTTGTAVFKSCTFTSDVPDKFRSIAPGDHILLNCPVIDEDMVDTYRLGAVNVVKISDDVVSNISDLWSTGGTASDIWNYDISNISLNNLSGTILNEISANTNSNQVEFSEIKAYSKKAADESSEINISINND
jgi:hypothetical protein